MFEYSTWAELITRHIYRCLRVYSLLVIGRVYLLHPGNTSQPSVHPPPPSTATSHALALFAFYDPRCRHARAQMDELNAFGFVGAKTRQGVVVLEFEFGGAERVGFGGVGYIRSIGQARTGVVPRFSEVQQPVLPYFPLALRLTGLRGVDESIGIPIRHIVHPMTSHPKAVASAFQVSTAMISIFIRTYSDYKQYTRSLSPIFFHPRPLDSDAMGRRARPQNDLIALPIRIFSQVEGSHPHS
ncbi:hypothetical protein CPB83DRAFT_835660 [Crepidotus variabilis]|uniref:Uncharacterized protein n=1 Tax=Crepidotus variabilis TaxID=179855 RepID=A0A9P6EGV0_9AGAR|nr:hypothetical protein CPB83DRAFT_835660 [Crepidotus variabilis]